MSEGELEIHKHGFGQRVLPENQPTSLNWLEGQVRDAEI